MPNWCSNVLRAIGSKGEIDRLLEKAQGHGVAWPEGPADECARRKLLLDLNRFVPMPSEIVTAGYVNADTWCQQNWGTRTNVYPGTKRERICDYEVQFLFDTAWSPPRAVVVAMADQFPSLILELGYSELGMGFAGTLICVNGVVVLDEWYPYSIEDVPTVVTDDPGVEARLENVEDL